MLKVIMNKMNGTIKEIITKKAEEIIKEELAQRIPEPKKVTKSKQKELAYVENLLRSKKSSELMLIN